MVLPSCPLNKGVNNMKLLIILLLITSNAAFCQVHVKKLDGSGEKYLDNSRENNDKAFGATFAMSTKIFNGKWSRMLIVNDEFIVVVFCGVYSKDRTAFTLYKEKLNIAVDCQDENHL
jgi:hypothetical protein